MSNHPPSLGRLCFSAVMITSNGWLDVLLYTLTRRIMIFSDEPPREDNGIDTFSPIWKDSPKRFGARTIIETTAVPRAPNHKAKPSHARSGRGLVSISTRDESKEDLCGMSSKDIKLETTTTVVSEPAVQEDYDALEEEARKKRPKTPTERYSEESIVGMKLEHIPDV